MRIRWQPETISPAPGTYGHGLCICRTGGGRPHERLIAFVDGFAWLRDGTEAVVQFDAMSFPPPGPEADALRSAIENALRSGRLAGDLTPGYEVSANA